jgi:hypothetical protein
MLTHGINVLQQGTSVGTPSAASVGIPFFIGAAPVQSAGSPAPAGDPVLVTSWDEAVERLGFADFDFESNTWKYNLCEGMYSHFKLYGKQPAIFCNLLDAATMTSAVAAADIDAANNRALLPLEAINNETLVVKAAGGTGGVLVKGTDYEAFYSGGNLVIELLSGGSVFGADKINAAYRAVTPESVTPNAVAAGFQNADKCITSFGVLPDLLLAPGYSHNSAVAAVMAAKAEGIGGLFRAKALVDISAAASGGALTHTGAVVEKGKNNISGKTQIAVWPMLGLGGRIFHMSTQYAGVIAVTDGGNGGIPYESPSNKGLQCDSLVLADGTPVTLTLAQANILNANGINTALNFLGRNVAWGNYTAAYPAVTDPKDFFIPISRMFDWVGNTVIRTFWGRLDEPMSRRLVDSITDTCNIWLNGLVGQGFLLGANVTARESDNPVTSLMAGTIRVHIAITPPPPFQRGDFVLEFDVNNLTALAA